MDVPSQKEKESKDKQAKKCKSNDGPNSIILKSFITPCECQQGIIFLARSRQSIASDSPENYMDFRVFRIGTIVQLYNMQLYTVSSTKVEKAADRQISQGQIPAEMLHRC